MKKSFLYGAFVIGAVAAAGIFVWKSERYPVLSVNGISLSARDYHSYVRGFERYRQKANDPTDSAVAEQAMVMAFVVDAVLRSELDRRALANDVERESEAALDGKETNLAKAAYELYGWDIATFQRFAIEPRVREERLRRELEKEGIVLEDWIRSNLAAASVSVYGLPYEWTLDRLVRKKK